LFGDNGVLTNDHGDCLDILGPPFFLRASCHDVFPVKSMPSCWSSYQNEKIPSRLGQFYNSCTRKPHFFSIIRAGFLETRKKLPRHLYRNTKERRKYSRLLTATFYDVLWLYSESFRYRGLHLPDEVIHKPFFWNRTIRWLPSMLITGILFILAQTPSNGRKLYSIWRTSLAKNGQLASIFSESRGGIFSV
jgi:hypothetical protein